MCHHWCITCQSGPEDSGSDSIVVHGQTSAAFDHSSHVFGQTISCCMRSNPGRRQVSVFRTNWCAVTKRSTGIGERASSRFIALIHSLFPTRYSLFPTPQSLLANPLFNRHSKLLHDISGHCPGKDFQPAPVRAIPDLDHRAVIQRPGNLRKQ